MVKKKINKKKLKKNINNNIKKISKNYGIIKTISDGRLNIIGLKNVKLAEKLLIPSGNGIATVISIQKDGIIDAILLNEGAKIVQNSIVLSTKELISISVSSKSLGKFLRPL